MVNEWFSNFIKLAEHLLLNSSYSPLAIYLAAFRLSLEQENWGGKSSLSNDTKYPLEAQFDYYITIIDEFLKYHIWIKITFTHIQNSY